MRSKRPVLSQQVTTRHQQTDLHESITKLDKNNINDLQKKHPRLGTVSKNILLNGSLYFVLKRFKDTSAEPLPHMFNRVHVRQQAQPWKASNVLLIFVFLDDASKVRSCNVISEHHVLAI